MQEMNVKQFAGELKMQPEHLLEQLKSAGVNKTSINDALSHTDKERLLDFLRQGRNEEGVSRSSARKPQKCVPTTLPAAHAPSRSKCARSACCARPKPPVRQQRLL